MLIISEEHRFTHEVTAKVPVDGGHENQTFQATFVLLPDDERLEYDNGDNSGMVALVDRVWVGASDIQTLDGECLEFTNELKKNLLGRPFIWLALWNAYYAGIAGAPAGN